MRGGRGYFPQSGALAAGTSRPVSHKHYGMTKHDTGARCHGHGRGIFILTTHPHFVVKGDSVRKDPVVEGIL